MRFQVMAEKVFRVVRSLLRIALFSVELMVYRYLASYKDYLNARTAYVLCMQERGRGNGS
jgi:hypothetical protein